MEYLDWVCHNPPPSDTTTGVGLALEVEMEFSAGSRDLVKSLAHPAAQPRSLDVDVSTFLELS